LRDVTRDDYGRPDTPLDADELNTLLRCLDYQSATSAWDFSGLSDDQLRKTRNPTDMALGGLIEHLARLENYWFNQVVAVARCPTTTRSAAR
jgi:hypothetical protein